MMLCLEIGGAELTDIAKLLNVGHYSTESQTIDRENVLMAESRILD
jgi:hypothetical protein